MKLSALPQAAAERLLDLDERTAALLTAADQADAAVEYARAVIGGRTEVTPARFEQVREGFDVAYAQAKSTRAQADSARVVLQACRNWIERLPADARLSLAQPASSDLDLAALKAKLTAMRDELRILNNNPPLDPDIGQRVDEVVAGYAAAALPFVRGFAQEQSLDVRWPMDVKADRRNASGCDTNNCNPLLMAAALFPKQLSELIMRTVREAQPLTQAQHATRRSELERAIDEASYAISSALNQAGELPDPLCAPHHVLGLKITRDEPVDEKVRVLARQIRA